MRVEEGGEGGEAATDECGELLEKRKEVLVLIVLGGMLCVNEMED